MWNFFKKKDEHQKATERMPGFKFSGGRGESPQDAIKIEPKNIKTIQEVFRKDFSKRLPQEILQSDDGINGLIGEMVKMKYLAERFGKMDQDWFCEKRIYLESTIQSQVVRLANGTKLILHFDFSAFHGSFNQNEASPSDNPIYINRTVPPQNLSFVGRKRSMNMNSEMFGVLVLVAYSGGWLGGSHLIKIADGKAAIRGIPTGTTLDDKEALTFVEALRREMKVDIQSIENTELKPVLELIKLCEEGGFVIQCSTNN